jgi:hypothetical protein
MSSLHCNRLGHILACRPLGSVLDIKKSSHKKLSKWLQNKASTGLVSFHLLDSEVHADFYTSQGKKVIKQFFRLMLNHDTVTYPQLH